MNEPLQDSASRTFEALQPSLVRLAYRMMASVADAEDIVQTAFMRWNAIEHRDVRNPEAYLRRVVTRLCLDAMRTIRRRREVYIGEWLPDPIIEEEPQEDVTISLMLALERLSPLERAAFLLHDVFGVSFEEIATSIDRSPTAVRQLASRARSNVRNAHKRYEVEKTRGTEIAAAFYEASRSGNIEDLRSMLAEDVSLHADGGGNRPTITRPVLGISEVLAVFQQFAEVFRKTGSTLLRVVTVSGLPGTITREADGEIQTTALEIENDLIRAIYVIRNPEKLRHLSGHL
ncbi:MAG: sigma-70 family RNA polymerase sigma factor [Geminicoccaceae bacterium]|nr:sigma-70 family RNA polymerase sigma factor [Geminicoccaceae bacterium]